MSSCHKLMPHAVALLFFLLFLPGKVRSAMNSCETLEMTTLYHIMSDYNENIRPPPNSQPTVVTVDLFIKNILWVNESSRKWKVQMTLSQEWNDPRLKYSTVGCPQYKYLTLTSAKDVWTPDLFFPLEEEAFMHDVPQPNFLLRIHPSGDVLYSTRITMVMDCNGQGSFRGEFLCPILISSYAHVNDQIVLAWREQDTIQMDMDRISLEDFTIGRISTEISERVTLTGKYSAAVAKFGFLKNLCRP